jgi:hypothetical protein
MHDYNHPYSRMTERTPGPWRILEVVPAYGDLRAGLYFRSSDGVNGVYSSGAVEHHFEILSEVEHMNDIFGSGDGGVICKIPIVYTPEGRAQALANAPAGGNK